MSTPVSIIQSDTIWFKNFQVLFKADRMTEFVPTGFQTLEERMNALARFGLYITILVMVYRRDFTKIVIFPIVLGITYAIYKNYKKEDFDEVTSDVNKKNMLLKEQESKAPKPTLNNPFMNVLMNDYVEQPKKDAAPNYFEDTKDAEAMRTDISEKFKHDLYMGIDDVYEKNNAQRQFYTTPNTQIPSDQEKYLKFMYPNMTSCKDDAKNCKINEDVRGRPFIFPDQDANPTTIN